jgi:hypothetical protein
MIKVSISALEGKPIPCLIWAYRELGLEKAAGDYLKTTGRECSVDHILCNAATNEALKRIIKESWRQWDFDKRPIGGLGDGEDFVILGKRKKPLKESPVTESDMSMEFLFEGPTVTPDPFGPLTDSENVMQWYREAQKLTIPDGELWFDPTPRSKDRVLGAGWLSPMGEFFYLNGMDHEEYAVKNFGSTTKRLEERGWAQTRLIRIGDPKDPKLDIFHLTKFEQSVVTLTQPQYEWAKANMIYDLERYRIRRSEQSEKEQEQ